MRRYPAVALVATSIGAALSGCASHQASPESSPAALAALHADVRVVAGETTWVTRGKGYELVGRTRSDLLMVQPGLDRATAFLSEIYPHDSISTLVATVRRAPAPEKPFVAAAPVPPDEKGTRVELVLVDPKALEEQRKKHEGPGPGMEMMGPGLAGPITPAVRAWMSSHASRLTASPARSNQARGEIDDPRVPAWAVAMIGAAGDEAMIDNATQSLSAHMETLIPLAKYLTMERPTPFEAPTGGRGEAGGRTPSEGRGGMGGGRRGGMGGRGGTPGGSGGSSQRSFALQGPALFTAESAVLEKYFARSGYDVVGDLIDAQITGSAIDDVLAKHGMGSLSQVDADWRGWLIERGDLLNRQR
jgi:hypothetical protein